ncbi:TPA: sortase [Enterococcus faecium]
MRLKQNLIVGKEYTVTGKLMDKETGKALLVDGKEVTASAKFTAKTPNGKIPVEFTFNTTGLDDKELVAFESMTHEDKEVATHADINDKGQTVKVDKKTPKISNSENQPDYVGKDVKPLTVEAMKKVDAEKVISNFGMGTIQIPSIGMNLPILEGMSQENLSVGAGTMKPNQELGKGNFTLAGHYMTNAGLLFGGIKNVKKNDPVQVTYKNKTINFKVVKIEHITAEDNQVIFDSEGNGILTLITCDSSVDGTNGRLMVRAVRS